MPHRNQSTAIPDSSSIPQDIIDLTEDSPLNAALMRSRNRVDRDERAPNIDTESIETVSIETVSIEDNDLNNKAPCRKHKKNRPAIVINLEDTINLDDTPNTANQLPLLQESSPHYKRGLSCPICFESLADENITPMTTPCGHVYCLECLEQVTQAKKKCSLCQRPITFSRCIRLHI